MQKLKFLALFLFLSCFAVAQNKISGSVFDDSGQALSGATIRIENTFHATTSDSKGGFEIETKNQDSPTLLISYIGFETIRIEDYLNSSDALKITMKKSRILAGEVVITGIRAGTNTPLPTTKITREELSAKNMGQDIPVLLEDIPSTVSTSDAGAGVGYTALRIRGSDATRINVTINGVPLNDSESQGLYWVNLPDLAASVEDIEVQRGVGTSTNGAGAFGASVNVLTRDISSQAYGEYSGGYGSFNTLRNSLGFGTGLLKNNLAFSGRLSKINSDGYIDRASSDLKSLYLTGAWYGDKNTLRFHILSGKEITYQAWNGVHQDSLKTNRTVNTAGMYFNDDGTISFYDNEVDNYQQDHYQLSFSRKISNKINFNSTLHYTYGRGFYEQYKEDQSLMDYGVNDIILDSTVISTTDLIRRRWLDNNFYGVTYSLTYDPSIRTKYILGGAYSIYNGDHFGEIIWARYAGNSEIRKKYYSDDSEKKDFNIFIKMTHAITDKLTGFLDIQYRTINYNFTGLNQSFELTKKSAIPSFFNPKAGLSYQINKSLQTYVYYGVANKEPSRDDFKQSSPSTQPLSENLMDLEGGLRAEINKLKFAINFYNMAYKDQLVLTGKINDVGEYSRQNVPNSSRTGVEIELSYPIAKNLSLSGNLMMGNSKIKQFTEYIDDYDTGEQEEIVHKNKSIAYSPEFISAVGLNWYPVKHFKVNINSKFVGKQYMDNTENENRKLESYSILNSRFNYSFVLKSKQVIDLTASLNNLTDLMYSSNGYTFSYIYDQNKTTENYFYPQAGINGAIGLALKF